MLLNVSISIQCPAFSLSNTILLLFLGINVNVKSLGKIVKHDIPENEYSEDYDNHDRIKEQITQRINKLQQEVEEQMQRQAQASKALSLCEAQNEFEGSYERVEFERLLLEAHQKCGSVSGRYGANFEISRLKNLVANGQFSSFNGKSSESNYFIF